MNGGTGANRLYPCKVRRFAPRAKDAAQGPQQEAAKIDGMDRQTLRGWVIRLNEHCCCARNRLLGQPRKVMSIACRDWTEARRRLSPFLVDARSTASSVAGPFPVNL